MISKHQDNDGNGHTAWHSAISMASRGDLGAPVGNGHTRTAERAVRARRRHPGPPIALPEPGLRLEQDAEWCLVQMDGEWKHIRFHNYADIYRIPGLYERLFCEVLRCRSPRRVCRELVFQMTQAGVSSRALRVLDFGAGNGMVGEELHRLGVRRLVGADIVPEAASAAERDRPGIYDEYHVLDFTRLTEADRERLRTNRFNCLTCVAALGFGDIPVDAFSAAFNLVEDDGWIAFNIKEEFVFDTKRSDFATHIRRMTEEGVLEVVECERYRHRISTSRKPLYYCIFIGRKRRAIV